jgi:hypothetical protein
MAWLRRYVNGGDNEALKTWAAKTLPDLKHHLQMAHRHAPLNLRDPRSVVSRR